jgi:hypothetical protein
MLLSAVAASAMAQDHKVVEGVSIYLGIVPARMILDHPEGHPEFKMHGGVPLGSGQYHVMVALFDANTGERITDATVTGRVFAGKPAGPEKTLGAMDIANSVTYGNYFAMNASGPYKVVVHIYRPKIDHIIEAQFEHKHQ